MIRRQSTSSESSTWSGILPSLSFGRPQLPESLGLQEQFPKVNELIDFGKLPFRCPGIAQSVNWAKFALIQCPPTLPDCFLDMAPAVFRAACWDPTSDCWADLSTGVNVMWPKYVEVDASGAPNPMAPHWAKAIFEDTTLLYAALFAFSKYREFLCGHCTDANDQLLYLTTCLGHLRQRLTDEGSEASDEMILTILSLVPAEVRPDAGTTPAPTEVVSQTWAPPWLTVYAKTVDRSPHIHAAFRLVEMRGGIENIKLYGLQRLVAL